MFQKIINVMLSCNNGQCESSPDSLSGDNLFVVEKNSNNNPIITKRKLIASDIFKELVEYQIENTPQQWKLNYNDMKRICKNVDTSILDSNDCCIWKGEISNIAGCKYIKFYFKNKTVLLHRLLYSNYIEVLDSSEYLKFTCDNKGICCNPYHCKKYKYNGSTC